MAVKKNASVEPILVTLWLENATVPQDLLDHIVKNYVLMENMGQNVYNVVTVSMVVPVIQCLANVLVLLDGLDPHVM